MIIAEKPTTVKSSGIKDSVSFGIKSDGLHHILNILRNQLYSDKILAIVREVSTNAFDANVDAGNGDKPIVVTLPNRLYPEFKIRDFGRGLTDEDIHEIYAFYGASTKRGSNQFTGCLGIGSKSPFCYSDNFVINSFINGVKNVYNAFIDDSQVGQIAKLHSEATTEPNGVEVVVSVRDGDADVFIDRARNVFQFFKVKPTFKGANIEFAKETEATLSGDNWAIYGKSDSSVAVMGNIGYPIDFYSLKSQNSKYSALLNCGVRINFNIGDLEISASREKLQYSNKTIKNITDTLDKILQEIVVKLSEKVKHCETFFDAKCIHGTIFNYGSPLYSISNILNKIVWNNQSITDSDISFDYADVQGDKAIASVRRYEKSWRGSRITSNEVHRISCMEKTVLIFNDTNITNGITNRVYTLIQQNKAVFVVTVKNDSFFKKYNLDKQKNFTLMSSLVPVSLGTSGGNVGPKNAKHSAKVFSFDTSKSGYQRVKSSYWLQETVDLTKDSGIYVPIDQFQYEGKRGRDATYQDPSSLPFDIKNLKSLGIVCPKIYGFKKDVVEKIKNNKNWKDFDTYIAEELENFCKNDKIGQAIADKLEYNKHYTQWWNTQNFADLFADNSPMKDAIEMIAFCNHNKDKITDKVNVIQNHFQFPIKDTAPTFNLQKLNEDIVKIYPMINVCHWSNLHGDKDHQKTFADYVKLVDSSNGK